MRQSPNRFLHLWFESPRRRSSPGTKIFERRRRYNPHSILFLISSTLYLRIFSCRRSPSVIGNSAELIYFFPSVTNFSPPSLYIEFENRYQIDCFLTLSHYSSTSPHKKSASLSIFSEIFRSQTALTATVVKP